MPGDMLALYIAAFNSLFEMLTVQYEDGGIEKMHLPFNSLFEMRPRLGAT